MGLGGCKMTKEEIIEMAKQAGFERLGVYAQFGDDWVGFTKDLETFAKMVAEKECQECAKLCEDQMQGKSIWIEGARACSLAIFARGQE
jgi:hypothetical protein